MVVRIASDDITDRIFGALSDATRRDILTRSMGSGQSVSTLARGYEMSFAAVQKHVAVLERADLVTKQRSGREQIVRANATTLRQAAELLQAYEQLWIQRVDQIAEILATENADAERQEGESSMTVISSTKDESAMTLTVVAEFKASPGAGLGRVGRSAQARALVGSAYLSGHVHPARVRGRR